MAEAQRTVATATATTHAAPGVTIVPRRDAHRTMVAVEWRGAHSVGVNIERPQPLITDPARAQQSDGLVAADSARHVSGVSCSAGGGARASSTRARAAAQRRAHPVPAARLGLLCCSHSYRPILPTRPNHPKQHKQTDAILRVTSTAVCGSDLHLYLNGVPGMQKGALFCAESPNQTTLHAPSAAATGPSSPFPLLCAGRSRAHTRSPTATRARTHTHNWLLMQATCWATSSWAWSTRWGPPCAGWPRATAASPRSASPAASATSASRRGWEASGGIAELIPLLLPHAQRCGGARCARGRIKTGNTD